MKILKAIFLRLALAGFLIVNASAAWITNDTLIDIADTNYDGADILITNCTLTVNGAHSFANLQILAGGRLTHGFFPSGIISEMVTVVDEPQIMSEGMPATLIHSNIDLLASLLVVMDTNKTITYTNGTDYEIGVLSGSSIQLGRTTNSSIGDGATVLVSYTYSNILANAGLNLTVTGSVDVAPGGLIDVMGRGYAGGYGDGRGGSLGSPASGAGGGCGGFGGMSSSNALGGGCHGSFVQPSVLGGSGGAGYSGVGGGGGGAVKIIAGGIFTLNGAITADGANGTNSRSGGGAGGSVWISATHFSGTGSITANGGAGEPVHGGGGGGGRIAIECGTNNFTGLIVAYGGAGWKSGGAGTVLTKQASQNGLIIIDNGGRAGTNTLLPNIETGSLVVSNMANVVTADSLVLCSLFVGSNCTLAMPYPKTPKTLTVSGDAIIQRGGAVHADAGGYPGGQSSTYGGAGKPSFTGLLSPCGGGSHAGYGGMGSHSNAFGGNYAYGSQTQPVSVGCGGGTNYRIFNGGAGGGALKITTMGSLIVDGRISANGDQGSGPGGGGGAGGSVYVTAGLLTGAGFITADGGDGVPTIGGGGGGGRVAVYAGTNRFAGRYSAYGGSGAIRGGAGTVFLKQQGEDQSQLIIDNGNHAGTNTLLQSEASASLIIRAAAVGTTPFSSGGITKLVFARVLLESNAWITSTKVTQYNYYPSLVSLTVTENVSIQSGCGINLDGKGGGLPSVPGGGRSQSVSPYAGGGGGHGGCGGNGIGTNASGGISYATPLSPAAGSSGGGSRYSPSGAGDGGGRIELRVAGMLQLDGSISANAMNGSGSGGGGGAGGGISIDTGIFAGSGILSANGGDGVAGVGGGGGGGRIAIVASNNAFAGTITFHGGSGANCGGAGTLYVKQYADRFGRLFMDNQGIAGSSTPLNPTTGMQVDLFVSNGAMMIPGNSLSNIVNLAILPGGLISTDPTKMNLTLATLGNLTVSAGAAISMDGRGFPIMTGPGNGGTLGDKGSGGGHGGSGGASASGATGGEINDSALFPQNPGSGGGAGLASISGGSEGGGAIRLSVGGTLMVDGSLSANGNAGLQDDSGGGAGGSIWVTAREVAGSGVISASGGDGDLYGGGGGGGGRIAIYSPSNRFNGLTGVSGGAGATPGEPGTWISGPFPGFQILSHSPSGVCSNAVNCVDVTFNERIGSVGTSNFVLWTPDGPLPQSSLSIYVSGLFSARVWFPLQNQPGDYRIEGAGILDVFGNPLAQTYSGSFSLALPTVSGSVHDTNGLPVAGVLVQPSGGYAPVETDANGRYSVSVSTGWTGSLTPALSGRMFVPGSLSFSSVTDTITNQNFLMVTTIAPSFDYSVAGTNLRISWNGFEGVTYQVWWSSDLVNWAPHGTPIAGSNGLMQMSIPMDTSPQMFFRIGAQN